MNKKIENTEGFKRDRRREILTVHGIEPGPSRVQGNLTDHYATRPSPGDKLKEINPPP